MVAAALAAAVITIGEPGPMQGAGNRVAWIPDSPNAVVLQRDGDARTFDRLAELRKALNERPGDAVAATRYGRLALQYLARTGDARFLGYADGALRYWQAERRPPQSVWLLRARILQSEHRFRAAADELLRMQKVHGASVEGMLLAADALRRAGDVNTAKSLCFRLGLTGHELLARYCAADVLLSLGQAEQAFNTVAAASVPFQNRDNPILQWALTVKADAAAAAGHVQFAETHYRQAIELPGASIALHVSYADLLLNHSRPEDALQALAALPNADAVLLRRAIAAKRLKRPEAGEFGDELRRRFAEAERFQFDRLHLRERAMFALFVDNDAEAALQYASANWQIQKGFEDAELLVEAARSAGVPDEAQIIDHWRRRFLASGG
ncbi:MAG: tetratricopeptide repeat protein [Woeseiaceae bacterium]